LQKIHRNSQPHNNYTVTYVQMMYIVLYMCVHKYSARVGCLCKVSKQYAATRSTVTKIQIIKYRAKLTINHD